MTVGMYLDICRSRDGWNYAKQAGGVRILNTSKLHVLGAQNAGGFSMLEMMVRRVYFHQRGTQYAALRVALLMSLEKVSRIAYVVPKTMARLRLSRERMF